jgi:naphthalene 1,2-dioxygenase system ferredoxin subunit
MAESDWHALGSADELPPGAVKAFTVNGNEVAVYNVDGDLYATDNICTHAYAQLSEGFLEGCEIECPLHFGRFDVRTGKGLCEPITQDLRTYDLRVDGGIIQICK